MNDVSIFDTEPITHCSSPVGLTSASFTFDPNVQVSDTSGLSILTIRPIAFPLSPSVFMCFCRTASSSSQIEISSSSTVSASVSIRSQSSIKSVSWSFVTVLEHAAKKKMPIKTMNFNISSIK